MDTDAMVSEIDVVHTKKDKKIKRKIDIRESIWRDIDDRSEELEMSKGDYVELAVNSLSDEESTIAQYRSMLEASKRTIENYRKKLKDAGIDVEKF